MTFRDMIYNAAENLWRMKLRTTLTVFGVIIAIGVFVSFLSFGVGMQEKVSEQFEEFGLFNTMNIYPPSEGAVDDSGMVINLDDSAITRFAELSGVRLVYPLDPFTVTVTIDSTEKTVSAQALSKQAFKTKAFTQFEAGGTVTSDSAREALVTRDFAEILDYDSFDSLIGKQIVLTMKVVSVDSGIAKVFQNTGRIIGEGFKQFNTDSLTNSEFLLSIARNELNSVMAFFLDGFMNSRAVISDTLIIKGVLKGHHGGPLRIKKLIVPLATAQRFSSGGISADPTNLFTSLQNLTALTGNTQTEYTGKNYPRVTLDLDPYAPYDPIRDTIQAMGYRTFSYADQFKEIRKFFLLFNLALGAVGLIALITAALGIVNTMIMSIIERTREIGILKSLGADEREIKLIFLVESSVIGMIGGTLGVVLGWLVTRVASLIGGIIMERQGLEPFEMFSLPLWLIGAALLFAVGVSLAAGYYPSRRAARVDPVVALRAD